MSKILHTYSYTGTPWAILKSVVPNSFLIKTLDEPKYDCLLREVVDADYLLVSGRLPIDEGVLSVAKRLKMIQRTGVGIDMLDMEAVRRHDIPVYVNRGVNARSVAEHALTLMLCCLKNIPMIDRNVKNGIWAKQKTGVSCNEIFGKTVGLVGLGAIGKLVASYLKVLGAKVLYTDIRRLPSDQEKELNVVYVPSFEEMLPLTDILSFHCPLTPQSVKLLNGRAMEIMKEGSIVINTARGKLIDEAALYKALINGKIRAAALDVHEEEPLLENDPLKSLPNVILTPHIGGLTYEAFHKMMFEAVRNIITFDNGEFDKIESSKL